MRIEGVGLMFVNAWTLLKDGLVAFIDDPPLEWRDVLVGAIVSALLFTAGKFLIGIYLGSSAVASTYGAAGARLVILLWVYYSSEVFLFGAELTRAYSVRHGSQKLDRASSLARS
jgi:membrane protein